MSLKSCQGTIGTTTPIEYLKSSSSHSFPQLASTDARTIEKKMI